MSKITYVVSNSGKQTVVVGSTIISPTTYNFPLTVEEDGTDDVSVNAYITAGLLSMVSAAAVALPQQNLASFTTGEGAAIKALVSGAGNLSYTARRRLESARYSTAGALINAPAWQATTAYKLLQQILLPGGQLIQCSTAGTSGASAPTFSAVALITDGTAVWCPTGRYSGLNGGAEIPTISASSTAPSGYSLTQIVDGTSRTLLAAAFTRFLMPCNPYAFASAGYQGVGSFHLNGSTGYPFGDSQLPQSAAAGITIWETITDDPNPAFNFLTSNQIAARLYVGSPAGDDMVQVEGGGTPVLGTNPSYYILTWPSGRKLRRYRIEMSNQQNTNLNGYAISAQSKMYAPSLDGLQGVFITDSFAGTVSGGIGLSPDYLGVASLRYAGIRYAQSCGQAGSGYGDGPGSGTWLGSAATAKIPLLFSNNAFTLPSQYATGVTFSPMVVVFAAGFNDSGSSSASITSGLLSSLRGARALWPNAVIIVFGPQNGAHNSNAGALACEAAISAAVTAFADSKSAFVPVLNDPAGAWTIGTGYVGATTGSGNSDFYTGVDGTHPPLWGHEYLARRYSYYIDKILASFGY